MKYYEAKATILCGACANYNPDLGRGMIGHSRPVAYGPRALKRPRAIRDWSGMADHAPALGLDCIFKLWEFLFPLARKMFLRYWTI